MDIILSTADSPTDRATIASLTSKLATRYTRRSVANYQPNRGSRFVSSFIAAYPEICRVFPPFASLSITNPSTPLLTAFHRAYHTVRDTLASTRDRFTDQPLRHSATRPAIGSTAPHTTPTAPASLPISCFLPSPSCS